MAAKQRRPRHPGTPGYATPDEYHTAYPDADPEAEGGVDNNAYTNVMAAWVLTRVLDAIDLLPETRWRELREHMGLCDEDRDLWDEMSRKLRIPMHQDGIISQFEGYEDLEEFDWEGYREKYGDIQRLDRILDAEGDSPSVDLIQRCYLGISMRGNVLHFDPAFPSGLHCVKVRLHYRNQTLEVEANHDMLKIRSGAYTTRLIIVAYRGHYREMAPGGSCRFRLRKPEERLRNENRAGPLHAGVPKRPRRQIEAGNAESDR